MKSFTSRLRAWLNDLPIQDSVERRVAVLFQVILLGLIALDLLGMLANLAIPGFSAREKLIGTAANLIGALFIGYLLNLLRRGHVRGAALLLILVLFTTPTLTVMGAADISIHNGVLFQLTLAIILSGLLVSRRALAFTFGLSALLVALGIFRGERAGFQSAMDGISIAINFILLNGIIALFLDRFSDTLRTALNNALAREGELQNQIAERERVEEALRASERKFFLLFEKAAFAATLSKLPDGALVNVNEAFEKAFGFTKREAMGRTSHELGINPDAQGRARILAVLEQQGSVRDLELVLRTKSGEMRAFTVNLDLVDIDGQKYILNMTQDITERKQAAEALRASRERLQLFFSQSLVGFFFSMLDEPKEWNDSVDKEKVIEYVLTHQHITEANDAMIEQYGASRENFLGCTASDFFAHDLEQARQFRRKLFDAGHLHLYTEERKADGATIWIEGDYVCIYDERGRIAGMFGIQRDVTERRRAEEALRDIQNRMRGIVESAMDAIISVNTKQQIVLVNSAAEQMFGYRAGKLMGKPLGELLPERFRDLHHRQVGQFGVTGKTRRSMTGLGTIHGLRANGEEFPAEASISQISVGADKMYTVILRDITARKQAEAEREKLIAELTFKNAELERFVYTVSHDLKSPLVTMTAFLGYLEQDALTGNIERFKGDTKRIANAVEKMSQLLNDLLDLSRIGRFVNPPETIPFEELARLAIQALDGQIQERGVRIEQQPDLSIVHVDKMRVIEVLQNLLDNAVKYIGDQPEPRIEIGQRGEEDGKPIFFVRDNGIGIAGEYHDRVFGLFNKLDARSEGTGIGLALVRRIIEFHGGRIWVESEVGRGAAFYFTLPGDPPLR